MSSRNCLCLKLSIIIFFLGGCKEYIVVDEGKLYFVEGSIVQQNEPVANVKVSLDNALNYTTYTNNSGYFKIKNVISGRHELTTSKTLDNGAFTMTKEELNVQSNISLNSLLLPKAVVLYDAKNITHKSVDLIWSRSDAPDFREYKLFRHTSSGLDENTGTLTHVATSIYDTIFTDESLDPNENYYYRIYIMNEFGTLGGSNIIQINTENYDLIINGDFELLDQNSQYPVDWEYFISSKLEPFSIATDNPISGTKYFLAELTEKHYMDNYLIQNIFSSEFVDNAIYELTFWYKHNTLVQNQGLIISLSEKNYNPIFSDNIISGPTDSVGWTKHSFRFSSPNSTPLKELRIVFYFYCHSQGMMRMGIDNVRLLRTE